jgi:hypothetical protein
MRTQRSHAAPSVNLSPLICVVSASLAFVGSSLAAGPTEGVWLITPEEAAMAPEAAGQITTRGLLPFDAAREAPDTGPLIEVLKPQDGKVLSPPLEVSVKFAPRNAPVDVSSLKVQVVKLVPIDITDRVRPYVTAEGIEIPDAKLPSGEHKVRINLSDNAGGVSRKEMTVTIP